MSSTLFPRQRLCVDALQCSVTPRKSDAQQFLRENRRGFIAADDWVSCFSSSQHFRLLHLRYPVGFDVQRPTTSVHKSTGPQRGYDKQMEWDLPRDSLKSHCTMEKTIESSYRAEWWRGSAHFSPFAVTAEISCIGLTNDFFTLQTLFTVKPKVINVRISHAVQHLLFFKNIISFCF